jgi:hypothetical protein
MLPAGDPWMEWTPSLVGTGIDGQSRSFDEMPISRPDGLGDITNLGLTLAEAKLLSAQIQHQVVSAQPTSMRCLGRIVSHAARGATRRVGGRIGLRGCSARYG